MHRYYQDSARLRHESVRCGCKQDHSPSAMSHWAKSSRRFFSVSSLSPRPSVVCPLRLNRCLPAYRVASIRRPEKNLPFIFYSQRERKVVWMVGGHSLSRMLGHSRGL